MATDAAAIERLQTSVVDGRTENGRYRQYQLHALHKILREEAGQICAAIQTDSKAPASEVETEYYLAMETVRHFYSTLDFEKDLEEEYRVVHGKDNPDRRLGVGLVVLRPTSHTRFYSVVTPLAAAVAAGNCVVLELSDTVLLVDSVLRSILGTALDPNTFSVVKSSPDQAVLDEALLVDQTGDGPPNTLTSQLLSSNNARCIAVVDRSADIEAAAKAITTARFSFGGSSPYAPDLVLVNEFVKKQFFEACSRHAASSFAGEIGAKKVLGNQSENTRKAIENAEEKRQVSSFGSNEFKLVDILDKSTPITETKITGRYLPIATCSSLTDAIYNQEHEKPLLAGYFFAEPASAKYLAQFLPCHISLINQIPAHLLVGPAAPTAHGTDLHYRYNRDMFSIPRPQFAQKPPSVFQKVDDLLSGGTGKSRGKITTSTLREAAIKPLPATGQSENEAVGFFESGLLTGAGIYLSVVLPVVGYTTYFLGRKGFEYAARLRQ